MDAEKAARLQKKYGHSQAEGNKKELNIGPNAARGHALGAVGKPKNLKSTVMRLFRYLGKERRQLILAMITAVVFSVSSLAASYLLRPAINKFIYYDPADANISVRLSGLFEALAVLALVYAINVFSQWAQQRLMLNVSQRSLRRMRGELYAKLQTLPISYFDNHAAGDVMSRFTNDVDAVGEMLNTTLIQIVSGIITIIGTVALMLYTNVFLGMLTIILTPLLVLASKWIVKRGRKSYVAQQQNLGVLNGYAQEMITGQKIIKVFNHEQTAVEEFGYLNEQLIKTQIRAQFQAGIMGPVTHQLCNVIYAVTACVGAVLVVKRGFDLGGLTVSVNYTRHFNRPINEISMQMNNVFSALAGAERVFQVLDEEPEKEETETCEEDGLSK